MAASERRQSGRRREAEEKSGKRAVRAESAWEESVDAAATDRGRREENVWYRCIDVSLVTLDAL